MFIPFVNLYKPLKGSLKGLKIDRPGLEKCLLLDGVFVYTLSLRYNGV